MNNTEFSNIGKTMPYKVSADYMQQACQQAKMLAKRTIARPSGLWWKVSAGVSVAVAAVVVVLCLHFTKPDAMEQYQSYLAQLSAEELANMCNDVEYVEESMYY